MGGLGWGGGLSNGSFAFPACSRAQAMLDAGGTPLRWVGAVGLGPEVCGRRVQDRVAVGTWGTGGAAGDGVPQWGRSRAASPGDNRLSPGGGSPPLPPSSQGH